ncbi:DUF885 family protein, partial [Streptomyces sp. NPDC127112]|uniref:DUF885 family protein n=1 Tax=Streptomyces sp. NPDC127112 TaxID=3345364 RepID=UPI003644F878
MSETLHGDGAALLPRQVADAYVDELIAINPITGTYLGVAASSGRLPDYSPAGREANARLARETLARLDAAEQLPGADADAERRCGRLLRERLNAELAVHGADEDLRAVSNIHSPAHEVREVFTLTPAETEEDWAAIAERLRAVPAAFAGYRESLALGLERGLLGGPRPTATFIGQLTTWAGQGEGGERDFFGEFASAGPDSLRAELDEAGAPPPPAGGGGRGGGGGGEAPARAGAPPPGGRARDAP